MPPESPTHSESWNLVAPQVDGIITAAEVRQTAEAIAEWQLPTGMIPWTPGDHADPWNHVEAAMALARAGLKIGYVN